MPPKSWLDQVERIRAEMGTIARKPSPAWMETAQGKSEIDSSIATDYSEVSGGAVSTCQTRVPKATQGSSDISIFMTSFLLLLRCRNTCGSGRPSPHPGGSCGCNAGGNSRDAG
jgi:hypothetical protein